MSILLRNRFLLVFIFSLAVISGPAYESMDKYQSWECGDCHTYLGLANGDFDQSPVRRYRVIIPALAGSINLVTERITKKLEPVTTPSDFSLHLSFLIVNSLMMALYALLIFRLTRTWVSSDISALIALLALLTCRWTALFAGWPLTDTLYFVVIGLSLLGIREKNCTMILISIMLGPWAKESYIFLAPLVLIFAPVNRWKIVLWFIISGAIVFSFRYLFDNFAGQNFTEGLMAGPSHFEYVGTSLRRLFSFHGLYELFSVTGIWILLFLLLIGKGAKAGIIFGSLPSYMFWYIPVVVVQMLLSTDIARMFYLIMPVLVVIYAIIIDSFIIRSPGVTPG